MKFSENWVREWVNPSISTEQLCDQITMLGLEVDGVEITNVTGNFPSSQTFLEVKTIETALAIKDGATNIDIVMPVGKFLSGDYEGVCDTIGELKQTCGDVPMKVILETGDLRNARDIKTASLLSMYAGADYLKTSTGKEKGQCYTRISLYHMPSHQRILR